MITAHAKKTVTIFDGATEYRIQYEDFDWMQPSDKGGIHPAITEDWHCWLFRPEQDMSECPIETVPITITDPVTGNRETYPVVPIKNFLQANYGPDNQIVTVPMTGDANAQRLHWIKRTPEEQAQMKAVLKWLNAWELTEDGDVPKPGDVVLRGHPDPNAPAPLPPDEAQ